MMSTPQGTIDVLTSFDEDLIRNDYYNKKPFILKNVTSKWPSAKWNFDFLRRKCGDCRVNVCKYDRSLNESFIIQHKDMRVMELRDFFDKHFMKDDAQWSVKEESRIFEEYPDLLYDLKLDEVTLPECRTGEKYMWVGTSDSSICLHCDLCDWNMLYQIVGRKKWKLYSPDDEKYLYVQTKTALDGGLYSMVDAFNPDLEKFPDFALAKEYEVIVEPGDLIYVPRRWWHAVYSMTYTLSVNHFSGEDKISPYLQYLEIFRLIVVHYWAKVLPTKLFGSDEEKRKLQRRKEVGDQVSGGFNDMLKNDILKDAPLGVRMMGKMISRLMKIIAKINK
jgi:ribosomal protein L16 Arg81 hydroxylase